MNTDINWEIATILTFWLIINFVFYAVFNALEQKYSKKGIMEGELVETLANKAYSLYSRFRGINPLEQTDETKP